MKNKLYPLLVSALLFITGCVGKEEPDVSDSISVTPSEASVSWQADVVEVRVRSFRDWILKPLDCEWAVPSVNQGKDGDVVTFNVEENTSGKAREVVFSFLAGQARTTCSISQAADDDKPDVPVVPAVSEKLDGTVIGTLYSVDYNSGNAVSTTVNSKNNVFDGDFDTFFASYDRSGTWVGLDLGRKHVVTKVGWAPRVGQEGRVELAVFEGANEPDFSDALPIYIIKKPGENYKMHYGDVTCSRGFRYVRYCGPNDVRCNLAELEFHGYEAEGNDSKLYQLTNLPTVVINTQDAQEVTSKETEILCNVYIVSEDGANLFSASQTGIRGRGNASWNYFPKKPYRLKFESKQSPLGAPVSAKKWTLISNYSDKSLMRNILAFEVSRRVGMAYTPFCTPVDVVFNGEYRGCYQLCDQVEAAKGRVDAKDGYLVEIDSYAYDEKVWFSSQKGAPVTIKHPDDEKITQEQIDFIKDYFNTMETAVFASNHTDPTAGYRRYLDLDSFLRNFIVGEFTGNPDALWSMYMYKDASDGRFYTGPVWDFDIALENDYTVHPVNELTDYLYYTRGRQASPSVKSMVSMIVRDDPQAKARLIELWAAANDQGKLHELLDIVDQTAELLDESQELNFKRWRILDHKVHMNYQALGSYEAEVNVVRTFLSERCDILDKIIRGD